MGPDVVSQTFCSSVAASVLIADHSRNTLGVPRFSVVAMNLSIQDPDFRRPASSIADPGRVVFKPVGVLACIIIALVPSGFAVVGNGECVVVFEWDGFWEVSENARDDFVLVGFWVHEG